MESYSEYYSNTKNRNKAYKTALSMLKHNQLYGRSAYLCCILETIVKKETGHSPFNPIYLFPEVYKFKPPGRDTHQAWWYATKETNYLFDYNSRIAALEECIRQTS